MIDDKLSNVLTLHRILLGVSLHQALPLLNDDETSGPAVGYYRTYLVFAVDMEAAEELARGDVRDGIAQSTEGEVTSLEETDADVRARLTPLEFPGIAWRSGRVYYQKRTRHDGEVRAAKTVRPWYQRWFRH